MIKILIGQTNNKIIEFHNSFTENILQLWEHA